MGASIRILLVAAAIFCVAAVADDLVQADPPTFVKKAATAGMAEVTLGNLAASRTKDAAVLQFAQRMVADHGKSNAELAKIAVARGLQVPTAVDAQHQKTIDSLGALSGTEFDRAYASHMVAAHGDAIALFEAAARMQDAELAAFAKSKLPTIREHRKMAEGLAAGHTAH